jgi:hypothetical protein
MIFVFAPDTLKNRNRVFDRGRLNFHALESTVEGGVFLDVFTILVERGRADALEFSAGKRGLEDVGCIHRALGRARADDRVHLVDEDDDVFCPLHFIHDRLDALLELTAVFGPGDHEGEILDLGPAIAATRLSKRSSRSASRFASVPSSVSSPSYASTARSPASPTERLPENTKL